MIDQGIIPCPVTERGWSLVVEGRLVAFLKLMLFASGRRVGGDCGSTKMPCHSAQTSTHDVCGGSSTQ